MTSRTLVSLCLLAAALTGCSEERVFTPPAVDLPMRNLQVVPEPREGLARGANVSFSLSFTSLSGGRMTLAARDQTGAALLTSEPSVVLVPERPTTLEVWFAVPATASSVDVIATYHAEGGAEPLPIHFPYTTR
jgi:hypothetical protein